MGKSKKRNNEGAGEDNSSVEVVEKEIEGKKTSEIKAELNSHCYNTCT